MSQQTINTGSSANSKNGDPLRTAFTKVNANFTELYTASVPYVKSTFIGGTATLDIFTATWTNNGGGPIRLQISVSNTVNVTLQYTATSIIAGTTTSTDGGGIWTQPPNNPPFSSNNLDNLGDIQVMYLQDITNQKIYRITGMNTAGSVNPAQGSVLIERII